MRGNVATWQRGTMATWPPQVTALPADPVSGGPYPQVIKDVTRRGVSNNPCPCRAPADNHLNHRHAQRNITVPSGTPPSSCF